MELFRRQDDLTLPVMGCVGDGLALRKART
jgi:hypothetical protein